MSVPENTAFARRLSNACPPIVPPFEAMSISPSAAFGSPFRFTVPDVVPVKSLSRAGKFTGSAARMLPAFTFVSVALTLVLFAPPAGAFTEKAIVPPPGSRTIPFRSSVPAGETKISVETLPTSRPRSDREASDALPSMVGS
jgi:hypothetical protein